MGLFICEECSCVENTALSRYWMRNVAIQSLRGRTLCSKCDPEIGKWHGRFPRTKVKMTPSSLANLPSVRRGALRTPVRVKEITWTREADSSTT